MRVISLAPRATSCSGLGDYRLETPRPEFSAQVGYDAEAARMVAALGDFDVGRGFWRGQEARRGFVVEIRGQKVSCALPVVAAEAALLLAVRRLRDGSEPPGLKPSSPFPALCGVKTPASLRTYFPRSCFVRAGEGFFAGVRYDCGAAGQNIEERRRGWRRREARCFENGFQLASADHGVDFRDALADSSR